MRMLICCCFFIFAVICRAAPPQSARDLFDAACWEILNHPKSVEVCVWHPKKSADKIEPGFSLSAYDPGKFVTLTPAFADLVTWKIVSDDSYSWNEAVDGPRVWHARVRYMKDGHSLTADFNFSSGIVLFSYDGKPFADGLMTAGSDWVFQLFERIFPNDRVFRSVREDKERIRRYRLDIEIAKAIEARSRAEDVEPSGRRQVLSRAEDVRS